MMSVAQAAKPRPFDRPLAVVLWGLRGLAIFLAAITLNEALTGPMSEGECIPGVTDCGVNVGAIVHQIVWPVAVVLLVLVVLTAVIPRWRRAAITVPAAAVAGVVSIAGFVLMQYTS